jgi:hypothetical protein
MYCGAVRHLDITDDFPLVIRFAGFPEVFEVFPNLSLLQAPCSTFMRKQEWPTNIYIKSVDFTSINLNTSVESPNLEALPGIWKTSYQVTLSVPPHQRSEYKKKEALQRDLLNRGNSLAKLNIGYLRTLMRVDLEDIINILQRQQAPVYPVPRTLEIYNCDYTLSSFIMVLDLLAATNDDFHLYMSPGTMGGHCLSLAEILGEIAWTKYSMSGITRDSGLSVSFWQ